MLKNGREAIYVAIVTGTFGALTVLLKDQKPIMAVALFVVTIVIVYLIIWRGMGKVKEAVVNPANHPVFYTIDNGIKIAFGYLPIKHPKKKKLVVQYIKTKYMLIRDALTATITDDNLAELPTRVITAVAETKDSLGGKAPEVFLEKMSEWDNRYNAWTMDTLSSIVSSNFYADKAMKYCACFDCIQVMVRSTLVAAEHTINELNGELELYLDGRDDV